MDNIYMNISGEQIWKELKVVIVLQIDSPTNTTPKMRSNIEDGLE